MILDLDRFIAAGRPRWQELADLIEALEHQRLSGDLDTLERLHHLYERASADLARLSTFASAPQVQRYLECLVARAYAEIHETRERPYRFAPLKLLLGDFPRAFRRHLSAFGLAVAVTLLGVTFGALALLFDPAAKEVIMPFPHLLGDPSERVREEESRQAGEAGAMHGTFSAQLIANNTRVGILCLALGMTWAVGTVIVLFYNGAILGAVCLDYIRAGEGLFLAGWLLPHGSTEIPAILIGGQAGLVLGRALLAGRERASVKARLQLVRADLVALVAGLAALLVWAGLVESYLSQTHEPALPYALKVGLGIGELGLLALLLARGGRRASP